MPSNGNTNQLIQRQPVGDGAILPVQQSIVGQPGFPASGPLKGAVVPYWSYGNGLPTFAAPVGSLYTQVDAAVGLNCFFIRLPGPVANVWSPII